MPVLTKLEKMVYLNYVTYDGGSPQFDRKEEKDEYLARYQPEAHYTG
ncbi:hypothetical protein [Ruminococcus callidus]|nr:hypothetical protein [Ruminococcus callidus]